MGKQEKPKPALSARQRFWLSKAEDAEDEGDGARAMMYRLLARPTAPGEADVKT